MKRSSQSWSPEKGKSMEEAAMLVSFDEKENLRYKKKNDLLYKNFINELKRDKFQSTQMIDKKQSRFANLKESPKNLYQRFVRWFLSKGANGGVLPNGGVILLVGFQILAFLSMKKISVNIARKLALPPGKRQPDAFSLSGRFIGWLIENGAVMTLCNLRSLLPHPEPLPDTEEDKYSLKEAIFVSLKVIIRNILISIASNLIAEQGAVYLLHLTSTRLYGNVPYFAKQNRSANPMSINAYKDWIQGNGILQLIGGGVLLGIIESFTPKKIANEITETSFSVVKFLRNYAVMRVIVDITFYIGHRFLHVNRWAYENIHRRHHEHYTTNLRTNFHFSAPDLFIESAFPLFTALVFLRMILGIKLSRYEIHLMLTYTAWHESGTHLGKPLPVISMYPPLSILYTAFTDLEKHAVEFHEVHHNRRNTNYGITQWIDAIMGTRMLKEDVKTGA